MDEICSDSCSCTCGANYKDENEHFQIHLVQEMMDLNKQLGQANIMKKESHNLKKKMTEQITVSSGLIALSICIIGWTLIAIHKKKI
jgi:hypothetical protein